MSKIGDLFQAIMMRSAPAEQAPAALPRSRAAQMSPQELLESNFGEIRPIRGKIQPPELITADMMPDGPIGIMNEDVPAFFAAVDSFKKVSKPRKKRK